MQTNKIGSVLLKSFKWIFVFSLMFITLFGIALALSQPQSAVGWVLAITPAVIWNFKRIFLLSYKLGRAMFLLIHKRKWTAIVFWGGCFWWQWQAALWLLIFLVSVKFFSHIKKICREGDFSSKNTAIMSSEDDLIDDEDCLVFPGSSLYNNGLGHSGSDDD